MKKKEWKVYFSGSLWRHEKGERCGREIPVGKSFLWGEEQWLVPSVYVTSSGLVIDFCVQVEPERIRAFLKKWNLWDEEPQAPDEEAWRQMEAENPLAVGIFPKVYVNGRELPEDHSCSVTWNPCLPEIPRNEEAKEAGAHSVQEAEEFLEHYGCDASKGWIFKRHAFYWATKRKPMLQNLSLCLKREPVYFAGGRFRTEKPGQKITFSHPVTGGQYTMTVTSVTKEKLEDVSFDDTMEWPQHYCKLEYTLSPELPEGEFVVQDCGSGDAPRPKRKKAAAVAVIGGACGPVSVFLAGGSRKSAHAAFSSLHFKPVDAVEWRMAFYVKMQDELSAELM